MPKEVSRYLNDDDPIELTDEDDDVELIDSGSDTIESTQFRKTRSVSRRGRNAPEFELQRDFTTYIQSRYPRALATSSIAGVYLHKRTAQRCKESGLVRGFPDYMVFTTRYDPTIQRIYCALFIEFKAPGRKVVRGSAQEEKLDGLDQEGYCVRVINNYDNAIQTIDWYMALPMLPYSRPLTIQNPMNFRRRISMNRIDHPMNM
jgi:hypothetical protein